MSIEIGCFNCGRRNGIVCEVEAPCDKFNRYEQWMPCTSEEKEKENKPMKKTKAMLEEELEQKKTEIEDLKKELEKAEKYKQYDDAAGEMKAMYDSFVNAGFNEDQTFTILMTMLQNQKAASNSWETYLAKYLSMHRK